LLPCGIPSPPTAFNLMVRQSRVVGTSAPHRRLPWLPAKWYNLPGDIKKIKPPCTSSSIFSTLLSTESEAVRPTTANRGDVVILLVHVLASTWGCTLMPTESVKSRLVPSNWPATCRAVARPATSQVQNVDNICKVAAGRFDKKSLNRPCLSTRNRDATLSITKDGTTVAATAWYNPPYASDLVV
jgi:hypothetical protein